MPNARINQAQIAARLKNSTSIRRTAMSMDPTDSSLILSMDLKPNTKVRVYQVIGNKSTSKVVIDLQAQ
ncbi:hypothetical protein D3C87_1566830 [compost metagenome]